MCLCVRLSVSLSVATSTNFRPRKRRENRAKIRFLEFCGWGIIKEFWPEYSPLHLEKFSNILRFSDFWCLSLWMRFLTLFCKIFTFPVFLGFRGVRILNKDRIRYSKVGLTFSKVEEKCGNFEDFQKSRFFPISKMWDHLRKNPHKHPAKKIASCERG